MAIGLIMQDWRSAKAKDGKAKEALKACSGYVDNICDHLMKTHFYAHIKVR
ncbi:hypothetical protein SLEP1_g23692 [Rubroshorea leprosula]|uniref:Uncharacterized protein n=1 Tax=Rubroshorea leprosula TaxID=152421 RepID=A0AAV5JQA1_9ROSI|nr:hypothetical protein SLEP1_g23692 [Rubroshorea leprosula]